MLWRAILRHLMMVNIAGARQGITRQVADKGKMSRHHRGCSGSPAMMRLIVRGSARSGARMTSGTPRLSGGRCLRGLATDVPVLVFYANAGGRRAGILSDMIRMAALI